MGREFLELFEQWADHYDETVAGSNNEYKEVFSRYEEILDRVVEQSFGNVVEFGTGTGNLTQKLLAKGLLVTGIEPSPSMRKIALEKLKGNVKILDGDFLHFPKLEPIDTLVSTYAFHHLTDKEKTEAVSTYSRLLSKGGRIVFADTMFESEEDYKQQIVKAKNEGFHNLAKDLETEYYTTIPFYKNLLEQNRFSVTFTRFNDFVWVMGGVKK